MRDKTQRTTNNEQIGSVALAFQADISIMRHYPLSFRTGNQGRELRLIGWNKKPVAEGIVSMKSVTDGSADS